MDSPQYFEFLGSKQEKSLSFKPYYKWIVLNTIITNNGTQMYKIKF